MLNKEEKLKQAVVTLGDEISDIEGKLEKSCILIEELINEYFIKYDPEKEDDKLCIIWDFSRYKTYANMIDDYVYAAKEAIDKLRIIEKRRYEENEKSKSA